jgi:pimeloyl-ACP methyl ester carboxylesterase
MISQQPLLLIPGLMCDQRMWRHQAAALKEHCSEILAGDISSADSIAELATRILQSAPAHFSMAGFSMGGIVALQIWRQAPQRVLRLALLDSNARNEKPERLALRLEQMHRVQQGKLHEVVVEDLKPNYLGLASKNDIALREEIIQMALSLGPDVFLRQCRALNSRPDSRSTLATITCPSLVLCGREDRLCPVEVHREMALGIPGARLQIIEHSGHFSPLEAAAEVSAAMEQWISLPVSADNKG